MFVTTSPSAANASSPSRCEFFSTGDVFKRTQLRESAAWDNAQTDSDDKYGEPLANLIWLLIL